MAPLTFMVTTCLWFLIHPDLSPSLRRNQTACATMPAGNPRLWAKASTHISTLLNFSDLLTKVLYGQKRRNLVNGTHHMYDGIKVSLTRVGVVGTHHRHLDCDVNPLSLDPNLLLWHMELKLCVGFVISSAWWVCLSMAPLMYMVTTCLWYSTHPDLSPNWRRNQIVYDTMLSENLPPRKNASQRTSPACWTLAICSPRCWMAKSAESLLMNLCLIFMNMTWIRWVIYSWLIWYASLTSRWQTWGDCKILSEWRE